MRSERRSAGWSVVTIFCLALGTGIDAMATDSVEGCEDTLKHALIQMQTGTAQSAKRRAWLIPLTEPFQKAKSQAGKAMRWALDEDTPALYEDGRHVVDNLLSSNPGQQKLAQEQVRTWIRRVENQGLLKGAHEEAGAAWIAERELLLHGSESPSQFRIPESLHGYDFVIAKQRHPASHWVEAFNPGATKKLRDSSSNGLGSLIREQRDVYQRYLDAKGLKFPVHVPVRIQSKPGQWDVVLMPFRDRDELQSAFREASSLVKDWSARSDTDKLVESRMRSYFAIREVNSAYPRLGSEEARRLARSDAEIKLHELHQREMARIQDVSPARVPDAALGEKVQWEKPTFQELPPLDEQKLYDLVHEEHATFGFWRDVFRERLGILEGVDAASVKFPYDLPLPTSLGQRIKSKDAPRGYRYFRFENQHELDTFIRSTREGLTELESGQAYWSGVLGKARSVPGASWVLDGRQLDISRSYSALGVMQSRAPELDPYNTVEFNSAIKRSKRRVRRLFDRGLVVNRAGVANRLDLEQLETLGKLNVVYKEGGRAGQLFRLGKELSDSLYETLFEKQVEQPQTAKAIRNLRNQEYASEFERFTGNKMDSEAGQMVRVVQLGLRNWKEIAATGGLVSTVGVKGYQVTKDAIRNAQDAKDEERIRQTRISEIAAASLDAPSETSDCVDRFGANEAKFNDCVKQVLGPGATELDLKLAMAERQVWLQARLKQGGLEVDDPELEGKAVQRMVDWVDEVAAGKLKRMRDAVTAEQRSMIRGLVRDAASMEKTGDLEMALLEIRKISPEAERALRPVLTYDREARIRENVEILKAERGAVSATTRGR